MKLCEEYKRLKDYEKMLRQQFKIDLKTLKAMSKKADELKMRNDIREEKKNVNV